jgi:hypothetical protein
MSTKTVRRKKTTAKLEEVDKQPEWRRICHTYEGESQISICGAARRKPGEDHSKRSARPAATAPASSVRPSSRPRTA